MNVNTNSDFFKILLLFFFLYCQIVFTAEISSESDECALIIVTSSEENTTDCEQQYPLDLSTRNKTINENLHYGNQTSENLSSTQNSSPLYINSPQFQISDFCINSTVFEKNEKGHYQTDRAYISRRHLKFFFTKKIIYDIAASDLSNKLVKNRILLPIQTLSITNHLLLNIKNDVIATMAAVFSFNFTKLVLLTHFKSINEIEDFLACLKNAMIMSPAHIKVNYELCYSLKEFSRMSYRSYNGKYFCLNALRLSRFIKSNINFFSLRGLLDTLFFVTYKCKYMQNDLRTIIFTILFFYNHAEEDLICNIEFILKDLMIRVILLVNIFDLIEYDNSKNERQKQEIYEKNKKEIERSFISAFHSRDLKKFIDNIHILREDISKSVLGHNFDFSFIVILLKSFKSEHYLKAILNDQEDSSLGQLKEKIRVSCIKMFELKESVFDMIKVF